MKRKQIAILILLYFTMMIYSGTKTQAISYEGDTGDNAGGLTSYVRWFDNHSGVLIVTSNFPNNTGVDICDITIIGVCTDESTIFRLRVHDSDEDQFINPDKELGIGVKERRFSIQPHMDTNFLVWTVQAASENGLIIYAEIKLVYMYDPDTSYDPVGGEEFNPDWEKEKRALVIRSYIWVTQALIGTVIAIFVAVKLANRIWGAG